MNDTLDSLFHSDAECASFLNDLPQVGAEGKAALERLLADCIIEDGQVVFEKLALQWNLGAPGGHA